MRKRHQKTLFAVRLDSQGHQALQLAFYFLVFVVGPIAALGGCQFYNCRSVDPKATLTSCFGPKE